MSDTWDLSNKKWLYWIAVVGFIVSFNFIFWIIAVILNLACDKGKPRTQNYQIKKTYEKFMIVAGILDIIGLVFFMLIVVIFGRTFY